MSTNDSPKEASKEDKEIVRLFEMLLQTIQPADKSNVNAHMRTADFIDIIQNHYPGAQFLSADEVYQLLIDHDFKTDFIGGEFVWMVYKVI